MPQAETSIELEFFDGTKQNLIAKDPGNELVTTTITNQEWNNSTIIAVILRKSETEWADVSGALHDDIGLSMSLNDKGNEHISTTAPTNTKSLVEFMLAYNNNDMNRVYSLLYDKEFKTEDIIKVNTEEKPKTKLTKSYIASLVGFIILIIMFLVGITSRSN